MCEQINRETWGRSHAGNISRGPVRVVNTADQAPKQFAMPVITTAYKLASPGLRQEIVTQLVTSNLDRCSHWLDLVTPGLDDT